METSITAAKAPPQPDVASASVEGGAASAARGPTPDSLDPMEEFSRRLEDILGAHASVATLPEWQAEEEAEGGERKDGAKEDRTVAMETEASLILQSLNSSSPEENLAAVVRRHAELAVLRRRDEETLDVLRRKVSDLLEERRSSSAARGRLEALCRELQGHYRELRDETVRRCSEDEQRRSEMTGHFQTMLTEIQAQIELHSARNDKLCRENTNLTEKLESLMSQCEQREASLDKISQHRELQNQLTEARLQQANALLAEAEEKHKREKEYLLREAIDKTKKCFAMKEQELAMKKKLLVQAAEWKLQAQTLREQATVMQAQLTLYAQKFDEFQGTLAKSNEIYVRFKNEMEKMSDRMKKMEKESNLWKTRFENCNKALTDMIEERTEKSKEYDLFVLKIQKLEKLCRALQEERTVLYDKIREVRQANTNLPMKVFGRFKVSGNSEGADPSPLLSPVEIQEIQEEDPVLTEDMARLREEQEKLQEFADSLLSSAADDKEDKDEDLDLEDLVASAFVQFKTKPRVKEETGSVPVDVKPEGEDADLPQPDKAQEVQKPDVLTPETTQAGAEEAQAQVQVPEVQPGHEPEEVKTGQATDPQPEPVNIQTLVQNKEVHQVKPEDEIQKQEAAPETEEVNSAHAAEPKIPETGEIKPVEDKEVQQPSAEPQQAAAEDPTASGSSPASAGTTNTKQAPKKKKKKINKNAS